MAAIGQVAAQIVAPQVDRQPQAPTSTSEKIRQFISSIGGIGTLFSILAGVVVAALWGVQFGLLAAGIGGLSTLVIANCRLEGEAVPIPVPEIRLDRMRQLHPSRLDLPRPDPDPLGPENIHHLLRFEGAVELAILKKSPHFYIGGRALFECLRNRFAGMDYSGLTLLSVEPVRYDGDKEGYEVTIQSQNPQGWIRLYISKSFPNAAREIVRDPQRIEQVAPFLPKYEAETNYFRSLELPFPDTGAIRLALVVDFRHLLVNVHQMDLCQVRLDSIRRVRYEHVYRPMGGNFIVDIFQRDGYEINFQTPNGPARYYVDMEGKHPAKREDIRNLVPL